MGCRSTICVALLGALPGVPVAWAGFAESERAELKVRDRPVPIAGGCADATAKLDGSTLDIAISEAKCPGIKEAAPLRMRIVVRNFRGPGSYRVTETSDGSTGSVRVVLGTPGDGVYGTSEAQGGVATVTIAADSGHWDASFAGNLALIGSAPITAPVSGRIRVRQSQAVQTTTGK